ncbi:MAG: sugar phosphate isomerase/epimerase [Caldilineaceae bacterium]|nr:sugar phosphate isomerase/epimerase [Caldilineaceae bacterium]
MASNIPVGLQLYSVRQEWAKDPRSTLAQVAAMGYAGVEFYGPPRHDADFLRALLDEFKLACCGWHTPYALVQDDTLFPSIAYHRALGNSRLIVPSLPADLRQTHADWLKAAEFFNRLADKLAPYGMVTGYHNHGVEFQPIEGQMPWYTLFDNTREAVVMQFDTGNALHGNQAVDPLEIIRRYPQRARTVHIKPFSKRIAQAQGPEAALRPLFGEDDTDWPEFFRLCETVGGTQWYIVEYESDGYAPMEAVARGRESLRALGV